MGRLIGARLRWLAIGFIILFILRFLYGYTTHPRGSQAQQLQAQQGDVPRWSYDLGLSNIATLKLGKGVGSQAVVVDQKYEKVATVSSRTSEFDEDERKVRELIREKSALIQFERSTGLRGNRELHLSIGVAPESFDAFVDAVKRVGTPSSLEISKTDKTNEYKELQAKRATLEKTRSALAGLKGRGGSVKDLVELENRILDIEGQIQSLGVKLGEFDKENEFCTVRLTLSEATVVARGIPLVQRVKVAFEWTVRIYLRLVLILLAGSLLILVLLHVAQKVRWFQELIREVGGGKE